MSKVGEKLFKEEIIINRFVNCTVVESVKYTGHPGPWFCPQIGLLTTLGSFPICKTKGISPQLLYKALSREKKKNYVKHRHYQLHTFCSFLAYSVSLTLSHTIVIDLENFSTRPL